MFKKAGFETKTMYVVPNLPSPLFATLAQGRSRRPKPRHRALAQVPEHPRVRRSRQPSAQPPSKTRERPSDEDGVLEADDR